MAGVMAARSLRRGAWIAPANEVLPGVLATLPPLAPAAEQALYATGVNPIRQLSQGFVAWGSFTQSLEPDLEDINVRRLLILLRRLALREGQNLVFAAHDAALRRRVQQQFEQILARLFDLGAFAGQVPAEAFQVVVDNTLNTQARVERGQLIVELRVAPAQPMTFITVRLVQLDSDPLTVQEVRSNGR
jgi:phage tail sheath protein FI